MSGQTHGEEYERTMQLIDEISELCEGVEYFDMLYALTSLLTTLLVEMEDATGKSAGPMFAKLFNDLLTEAKSLKELDDMDESNETAH